MGNDWDIPKWQREGRTGPGPAAPKYAKLSDRNKVRRGKPVGKNNGGKGGSNPGWYKPGGNGPYSWGNGPQPKKSGCCFAGQAVKAVWAGKFRLARRFARLDVKTRMGLI